MSNQIIHSRKESFSDFKKFQKNSKIKFEKQLTKMQNMKILIFGVTTIQIYSNPIDWDQVRVSNTYPSKAKVQFRHPFESSILAAGCGRMESSI